MIRALCLAAACIACTACAGAGTPAPAPEREGTAPIAISVLQRGNAIDRLQYQGRWQFVTHRHDGRFDGASARAFRAGDALSVLFYGTRLQLYGITGRNGGRGLLVMPGVAPRTLNFRSKGKRVHVLLYDSGRIANTLHSAGVVVLGRARGGTPGYVNVDEIAVER